MIGGSTFYYCEKKRDFWTSNCWLRQVLKRANAHLINLKICPVKWKASSHRCSAWYLLEFNWITKTWLINMYTTHKYLWDSQEGTCQKGSSNFLRLHFPCTVAAKACRTLTEFTSFLGVAKCLGCISWLCRFTCWNFYHQYNLYKSKGWMGAHELAWGPYRKKIWGRIIWFSLIKLHRHKQS